MSLGPKEQNPREKIGNFGPHMILLIGPISVRFKEKEFSVLGLIMHGN